jgi:RNA polymerase sigma-70 factor (ECF subfamily)
MKRTSGEARSDAAEQLRHWFVDGLAGDPAAYRQFLGKLAVHLRAFFRKRLAGLPDEVEDLVQETLLAVHLQRRTYDPDQPLTAWLHAIAKYKFVDMLRRRGHRENLTEPFDDANELFCARDDNASEARRDLAKLLERLPARQRLPIIYVKLEGLSVAEAAERTGLSVSAVKVGVHRGLKALATLLRSPK